MHDDNRAETHLSDVTVCDLLPHDAREFQRRIQAHMAFGVRTNILGDSPDVPKMKASSPEKTDVVQHSGNRFEYRRTNDGAGVVAKREIAISEPVEPPKTSDPVGDQGKVENICLFLSPERRQLSRRGSRNHGQPSVFMNMERTTTDIYLYHFFSIIVNFIFAKKQPHLTFRSHGAKKEQLRLSRQRNCGTGPEAAVAAARIVPADADLAAAGVEVHARHIAKPAPRARTERDVLHIQVVAGC